MDSGAAPVAPLVADHEKEKEGHPTSMHSVTEYRVWVSDGACVWLIPRPNKKTEEVENDQGSPRFSSSEQKDEEAERKMESTSNDWVRRGGTGSEGRWHSTELERHLREKVRWMSEKMSGGRGWEMSGSLSGCGDAIWPAGAGSNQHGEAMS